MNQASLITLFVSQYRREYDFYYELARLVSQECDALAAENGIRAIVTFRAKSPDRLEEKLRQREVTKKYQTEEDIRTDIVDLSGVRIALYFPGDRAKIAVLLRNAFVIDQEKQFPDKPKATADRFDGYHAEHYRIRLRPDALPEVQRRYGGNLVEIQVASVLMHAWSEVEHDLNYKQLSGQVSQEERSILDGINGIVLAGEVFLERLQAAFEARVSRSGSTFSNRYELAAFLYERLRVSTLPEGKEEPVMGRLDILFDLLQLAELNSPDKLTTYIQHLDLKTEKHPLADQIIDHVLISRADLYDSYLEMRRTANGGVRTFFSGQDYPSPAIVGSFFHKWIILERFLRGLAQIKNLTNKRGIFPTRHFVRNLGLSELFQIQFDLLSRLRSELVHGVNIPDENSLCDADAELNEMLEKLSSIDDKDIREAMHWAQSGEADRRDD